MIKIETIITRHAKKRLKERNGFNKKSMQRMADRAYEKGIPLSETKGQLHKWVTSVYFRNTEVNNLRIYGDKLYLFRDNILITILQVPQKYVNDMEAFIKKK